MHKKFELRPKLFLWLALGFSSVLALNACSAPEEPPNKMRPAAASATAAGTDDTAEADVLGQVGIQPDPTSPEIEAPADDDASGQGETKYQRYEWDEELGEFVLVEESSLAETQIIESRQFMAAQRLPADSPLWTAVTDEQKELIQYMRTHAAGEFTEHDEDLVIFLAVESCLAAIESGHEVDADIFKNYMAGSEQIQYILNSAGENSAAVERNVASMFTVGMGFLCADDYADWRSIYEELYG